ncbi:hypothetical protein [Subtercola endophyticus]|uniref:hypothetical protein n=1 Tax=Subtercola endophyticus TaxID=2895559 RepID=UPI001E39C977|nr:hypothetical protein [Subtercola endophyticus]UFS57683.1 hypothetical protein LQ955_11535 [Subtercola endophyticus]
MKRGSDDEALSWGDENDPTYVAPELDDSEDAPESELEPVSAPAEVAEPAAVAVPAEATGPAAATPARVDVAGSPRWASAAAPTEAVAAANAAAVADARAAQADQADDLAAEQELADAEAASQPLSSAALIAFGIFGGILFLYTIGWLVGFLRNPPTGSGLGGIVQAVLSVLTIFAPALWFIATLLLGAKRPVRTRILWLIIGVIVLVPWPFVTGY